MAVRTLSTCDVCKHEQDNDHTYFVDRITKISLRVPIDGVNGGFVSGDLCKPCRSRLSNLIVKFFQGEN